MIQASLQEALMELSVYKAKERADAAAAVETPVDLAPRIKEMEATHKEAQEEARKKAEENEVKIKVLTAKVRLPGLLRRAVRCRPLASVHSDPTQVDELTASLQNVEKHKSEAAAVNNKLTAELEDVRNELEKAYAPSPSTLLPCLLRHFARARPHKPQLPDDSSLRRRARDRSGGAAELGGGVGEERGAYLPCTQTRRRRTVHR